jgi:ABC-type polysaccharide/polyol phosphate export permease
MASELTQAETVIEVTADGSSAEGRDSFLEVVGEAFASVVRNRDLLRTFVWRDVQIKYKQSVMGLLWAVFMPAIIIGAGVLVRLAFAMLQDRPLELDEIISVTVKAVPWAFFIAAVRFATNSLISNLNLVTKVYFPRELFPIAAVISQMVDFAVASAVVAVLFVFTGIGASLQLLWVPVLVAILVLFSAGLGILLSAGALFFRDVKYLVEAALTFAIFFTPVFFSTSLFGAWGNLLLLNPVAPVLEGLQATIVHQQAPALIPLIYAGVVSTLLFAFSLRIFKKLEPAFAESI